MGLGGKRKSAWAWRQRWCRRVCMALIMIPATVAVCAVGVALVRTLSHNAPVLHLNLPHTEDFVDEANILLRAERLAGALRIQTVSYEPDVQEKQNILKLHQYLEKNFPFVHTSKFVKKEVINDYSLLYTIKGLQLDPTKLPYLLASHLDVVPADPKTWEVPPFSGNIINKTYIYGRGAIDDKSGVLGILEALEYLLEKGDQPQRSFFIAFGHDEESKCPHPFRPSPLLAEVTVRYYCNFLATAGPSYINRTSFYGLPVLLQISGRRGAQELAKILVSKGVTRLDFVLDEGFPVIEYSNLTADKKVALIGVTEKGSLTLELSVAGSPGHSSLPPSESPIGILASAVAKLEENQQPIMFGKGPEYATFQYLAPFVSFWHRLMYSNLWLFSGWIASEMDQNRAMRPFVRTTTAITKFNSGIKDNVIPPLATATVNHRIHPAQTVSQVVAHDREVIADPRVRLRIKVAREAHPVSTFGPDSLPFQLIAHTVKQIYKDAVVVPGVFIANTDTRWYLNLTSSLYRFVPTIITPEDLHRYHGNNERISIHHYHQAVNFYYRVIRNADLITSSHTSTSSPPPHSSLNEL